MAKVIIKTFFCNYLFQNIMCTANRQPIHALLCRHCGNHFRQEFLPCDTLSHTYIKRMPPINHQNSGRFWAIITTKLHLHKIKKLPLPLKTNGFGQLCQFFTLNEFSMLVISLENFLSNFMRCSTWLQLYITVEWSRPPTSLPMRLAGILVYFCARYIDT